ncbi:nuclear transport factor 2 family protein [Humisphaera borealis]|uniref:Nuclear transport factor 2 family protein n=1 Tax=Humisphaera borealis TaxID=2807512 RepID=A0A7M2WUW1_9BACT|nr:nuclear transport factor 2 family protein [Humisphaera borealis]QOV88982.1 nuclear transport factor 2 family protein [Humisphaera borealis]
MDLIFDAPWWLYIVPAIVGIVMAYLGLRKGDKTLRSVGVGLLLVGVVIFIASRAVETDTEKVSRQSRELVAAVEKREWDKLNALMEPDAAVTLAGVGEIYSTREQIVSACRSRADGSGVTALAITGLEPKREGAAQISAEVQIYVTANDGGGRPFPTGWRFVWARAADGRWLIHDIEAIQIGTYRPADARPWFPNAK